jgi:hypothetical protein
MSEALRAADKNDIKALRNSKTIFNYFSRSLLIPSLSTLIAM